jgi:formiminoglutamase
MTKTPHSQSQKRFQESLGSLFSKDAKNSPFECVFLKSSTDTGVIRNGGRNGARFAPQSFLSTFKKFSQSEELKKWTFFDQEVSNASEEESNFQEAQVKESEEITSIIKKHPSARLCHIGGGHDHIYPYLKALSAQYKKVIVINLDAHADTRTDEDFHSGTPFRQFADYFQGSFHLYQIGLHPFANSFSTLSPLKKGETDVLWKSQITPAAVKDFFKKIGTQVDAETLVVFSLDADAITGAEVPGVSAVNPAGLTRDELMMCWQSYMTLPFKHAPMMGIYELNPIYDTLASISMRTLGSFVFETFLEKR